MQTFNSPLNDGTYRTCAIDGDQLDVVVTNPDSTVAVEYHGSLAQAQKLANCLNQVMYLKEFIKA